MINFLSYFSFIMSFISCFKIDTFKFANKSIVALWFKIENFKNYSWDQVIIKTSLKFLKIFFVIYYLRIKWRELSIFERSVRQIILSSIIVFIPTIILFLSLSDSEKQQLLGSVFLVFLFHNTSIMLIQNFWIISIKPTKNILVLTFIINLILTTSLLMICYFSFYPQFVHLYNFVLGLYILLIWFNSAPEFFILMYYKNVDRDYFKKIGPEKLKIFREKRFRIRVVMTLIVQTLIWLILIFTKIEKNNTLFNIISTSGLIKVNIIHKWWLFISIFPFLFYSFLLMIILFIKFFNRQINIILKCISNTLEKLEGNRRIVNFILFFSIAIFLQLISYIFKKVI